MMCAHQLQAEAQLALKVAGRVDRGGSRGERRLHIIDDRKRLVRDLDQSQGARGRLLVNGSDGGNRIADVAHLFVAERRLVLHDDAEAVLSPDILRRHHRDNARQGFRRARVERRDSCVRNAGPEDARHQHAGATMVGEIGEPAGHLVLDIRANAPAFDQLVM